MLCAGELHVHVVWEDGVSSSVTQISDASGHYKPDGRACLWRAVEKLRQLGIPMGEKGQGLVHRASLPEKSWVVWRPFPWLSKKTLRICLWPTGNVMRVEAITVAEFDKKFGR